MIRIQLCGTLRIDRDGVPRPAPRGAKAWGLLAYLVLADAPVSRHRLAGLLFEDAADPMGALRWNLSQLRKALGSPELLQGDPLVLHLGEDDVVDVLELTATTPSQALDPTATGALLERLDLSSAPAFDAWLQLQRHHLRAALEARLVAEAERRLDEGEHAEAADLALRAIELDPLAVAPNALLVEAYVTAAAHDAARHHVRRCTDLYRRELGAPLPAEIAGALSPLPRVREVLTLQTAPPPAAAA